MITVNSGDLDTLVRFDRRVESDDIMGAGQETLEKVAEVRAQVLDQLPPRGLTSGAASIEGRQTRIMIRYRTDITPDMLVTFGGRTRSIISGPSIVGHRAGLVMMLEDYTPQGGVA